MIGIQEQTSGRGPTETSEGQRHKLSRHTHPQSHGHPAHGGRTVLEHKAEQQVHQRSSQQIAEHQLGGVAVRGQGVGVNAEKRQDQKQDAMPAERPFETGDVQAAAGRQQQGRVGQQQRVGT